jgi:hypothetical protein
VPAPKPALLLLAAAPPEICHSLPFNPKYKICSKSFVNIFTSTENFSILTIQVNLKELRDEPMMSYGYSGFTT